MSKIIPSEMLFKLALSSDKMPDEALNQIIIEKYRVMQGQIQRKKPVGRILLFAAILTAVTTGTALAAWLLRSPVELAMDRPELAGYLTGSESIVINESADIGDYRVTLLGIAPGASIKQLNRVLDSDKTYIVTAVQKLDGSDLLPLDAETAERFYALAFVRGVPPWHFIADAGVNLVEDGILFMVTQFDDVEFFADRGVYLTVSDQVFYSNDAYQYDSDTGDLLRSEEYEGVNALFMLPLDPSKADPVKADAILQAMYEPGHFPEPAESPESAAPAETVAPMETCDFIMPENEFERAMLRTELRYYYMDRPLQEYTLYMEAVKPCTIKNGNIVIEYAIEYEDGVRECKIILKYDTALFDENRLFIDYTTTPTVTWEKNREGYYFVELVVLYLDEDGAVWLKIYTVSSHVIPDEVKEAYIHRMAPLAGITPYAISLHRAHPCGYSPASGGEYPKQSSV